MTDYDHLSTFTHKTDARPNECAVCHRYFAEDDIAETVDDGTGNVGHCCEHCASTAGRKYDGPAALVLSVWAGVSGEDEFMAQDGSGYVGRFGRWLLLEDSSGFATADEYADVAKASARFDSIYADGMGAQEDDAFIGNENGWRGWSASYAGKALDVPARADGSTDRRRALAAVIVAMYRDGYFPNVWEENHYGVTLVKDIPWNVLDAFFMPATKTAD